MDREKIEQSIQDKRNERQELKDSKVSPLVAPVAGLGTFGVIYVAYWVFTLLNPGTSFAFSTISGFAGAFTVIFTIGFTGFYVYNNMEINRDIKKLDQEIENEIKELAQVKSNELTMDKNKELSSKIVKNKKNKKEINEMLRNLKQYEIENEKEEEMKR